MTEAQRLLSQYEDDLINIVYIGPLVPSAKCEKLIEALWYLEDAYQKQCRLFLVGSGPVNSGYTLLLKDYCAAGQRPETLLEIEADNHTERRRIYSQMANVLVLLKPRGTAPEALKECLEAQRPIVAIEDDAAKTVFGDAGVLLESMDAKLLAGLMYKILDDEFLAKEMLDSQQAQLKRLQQKEGRHE